MLVKLHSSDVSQCYLSYFLYGNWYGSLIFVGGKVLQGAKCPITWWIWIKILTFVSIKLPGQRWTIRIRIRADLRIIRIRADADADADTEIFCACSCGADADMML